MKNQFDRDRTKMKQVLSKHRITNRPVKSYTYSYDRHKNYFSVAEWSGKTSTVVKSLRMKTKLQTSGLKCCGTAGKFLRHACHNSEILAPNSICGT